MLRKFFALLSLALIATACGPSALPTSMPAATQATPDAIAPTATPPAPTATAVAMETPAPGTLGSACSTAYTAWDADGSKVFCLGEGGTPMLIADASQLGTVSNPEISPDGAFVAYMVNLIDGTAQLWVVNVTGLASGTAPQPHLLAGPDQVSRGDPNVVNSPLSFTWQPGTHTIFFNTRFNLLTGEAGPGDSSSADLWKADTDTGTVINVMSRNSVGRFFFSPDGKHIALSLPQTVGLVDTDMSNFRLLLNFPFIITYADYAYKPAIVWSPDSAFFSVAIPSADPLAPDTHVAFYQMNVDGNVQTLGTLPGNFVFGGQPRLEFSPDGKHAIYGRLAEDNSTSLHVVNADGSGDVVVDQQAWIRPPNMNWPPDLQVRGLGWSPDSNHYAYSVMPAEGGFLALVEGPLQSFAPGAQITSLKWYDGNSFAFIGQVNGQWGLYAQTIGAEPRLLVSGLNQNVMFDTRP